jgi:Flp pilus assembly protein CpaB
MTRVSSGTLTVVVFAILAGLAGAYIVRQRLVQPHPEIPLVAEATPNDVIVPVAAVDLQPGQMLTINDIALVRMSPLNFAKSKYVNQAYMRNSQQIEKRVLKLEVKRGEPFLPTAFYPDGAGPGIAEMLEEGYRAVTIPIEHISAVQGFARPGTYVDVLFRSRAEEDRPEVTITLLERVKVLAVNTNTLSEKNEKLENGGAVTLAVTPLEATSLKVVEDRGELSLTLRNPNDELDFLPVDLNRGENVKGIAGGPNDGLLHPVKKVRFADEGGQVPWWMGMERVTQGGNQVSLNDLLNIPPKPKPVTMTVYRGGAKEVLTFDEEAREPAPQMIRLPVQRPFVRERSSDPNGSKVRTVQFDKDPTEAGG